MAITAADELLIRQRLGAMILAGVGSEYRIVPAPLYAADKYDFLATDEAVADADKNEQDEIEETPIKACWVYLKSFEDSEESAPDSPVVDLYYEIVLFHEYYYVREDEAETPDSYNKKLLLNHNEFIEAVLGLKGEFQGVRNLGVLSTIDYSSQKTNSLVVTEEIENLTECQFIPKVLGHKITLRERVEVQLTEC